MNQHFQDYHYDYHDDFYEDVEEDDMEEFDDYYDESMDGDHESGLASAGWGLDESYNPSYDYDEYDHGGDW